MANQNQMTINGKDVDNPSAYLTINLADDKAEVRGFGQAITRARAKEMAITYFDKCKQGAELLKEIESNVVYKPLKDMAQFLQLKDIINPDSQTVSGVFGKEIILQILSMRQCEGIRYIIGNDGTQNTVILIGVREAGVTEDRSRATSAPVDLKAELRPVLGTHDVPVDGEVHEESMTIAKVQKVLDEKANLFNDPNAVLFGEY